MSSNRQAQIDALRSGAAVPLVRWLLADAETPVTAWTRLRPLGACVLLESVEGGERWGRFSVIGLAPRREVRIDRDRLLTTSDGVSRHVEDPLAALRELLAETRIERIGAERLPSFLGGWIGYFGYGMVHWIEPTVPDAKPEEMPFPEACFLEIGDLVLFDNVRHAMALVSVVDPRRDGAPEAALAAGEARLDRMQAALMEPFAPRLLRGEALDAAPAVFEARTPRAVYEAGVETAREAILAGDVIQVVLAQRFEAELRVTPFDVYRALRVINPSPYLFYLELAEGALIGSSPEVLVRKEGRQAALRPIAGTRRRGESPELDRALEAELLADPKEIAEHVMLVDLGRNDLGRVCAPGSVRVTEQMVVERYSHVMHIVSHVEGELGAGRDAVDLLRACFPAGTVSGAPKVRAMQLIEEIEPLRRGPYSGAVGYFSYDGDMDACITIRTFFAHGDRLVAQAGAGIVADSVPSSEHEECLNKARALFEAVRLAERGFALEST